MRISVEKPILRINHGNTFMVTDLAGQIQPLGHFGIFCDDTRFLSYYACYVDGHDWERLTSTTTAYYAARIEPSCKLSIDNPVDCGRAPGGEEGAVEGACVI